jgi:Fic-DOC domain mobile mystery protein B
MGLILQYDEGQTPLDEDEKADLLIPSVMTRRDLDEVEQRNIEEAVRWTIQRRRKWVPNVVLTEQFIRDVHIRMLGEVWKWAGQFRKSNKNIGVDKYLIGTELKRLLDDTRYWVEHRTYSEDEIAIRFKHRLVSIHCFANGNGRHSRLMADIVIEKLLGLSPFTWGTKETQADLVKAGNFRKNYIDALRQADGGNYEPLILFARS